MSRLTSTRYVEIHYRLRRLWLCDPYLFSQLSAPDQWSLHAFFVPDRDLGDAALLEHRAQVTSERPSLPQQAGRALSRFWETTAQVGMTRVARVKEPATKPVRGAERHLVVRGLVRPEIDTKALARAFLSLAEQRARRAAEPPSPESHRPRQL